VLRSISEFVEFDEAAEEHKQIGKN